MITRDDIRLFQAQANNDEDNGGGSMSGNEVVDGETNNLFPDVSRIDVTNGDVAMRKVFPAVISQNTDVYYGMHSIIRKNPDDDRVSVTMVNTKDPHDQRTEAQTKVESALTFSYEAQFYLYGNHIEGMRALTFMARLNTDPPPLGEAFYLYDEGADQGQYVRITDVSTITQTLSFANGNTYTDYKRLLFICEITAPLEHAFSGSVFNPAGNQSNVKTYHTTQANAVKYHGTKTLAADITDQDTVLQLDSIYNQLVPASLSQEAMVDQQGPRDLDLLITSIPDKFSGNNEDIRVTGVFTETYNVILSNSNNFTQVVDFGGPVLPGSFYTGGKADINGVVQLDANRTLTIDYANGTGVFQTTYTAGPSNTNINIAFSRTTKTTVPAHFTVSKEITSANNSLVFVLNIHPIPSPGSLRVEFRSGGRWYEINMNTLTTMGVNSDIGVGAINYNGDGSATISLTLGSEPDIGSRIICTWSHASGIEANKTDADYLFRLDLPLPAGEKLTRVAIEPQGTYFSGQRYYWDGSEFMKTSGSNGSIEGYIDEISGALYFTQIVSSSGERLPPSILATYDTAPIDGQGEAATPNGSGVVTLDIGTDTAAGNFIIKYPVTVNLNHSPTNAADIDVVLTVNQNGEVISLSGLSYKDPTRLFDSIQLSNFVVNAGAGTVTFHPTDGLTPSSRSYTATTYSNEPETVKKSYSKTAVEWSFGG